MSAFTLLLYVEKFEALPFSFVYLIYYEYINNEFQI